MDNETRERIRLRDLEDERFFPCNARESGILGDLSRDSLAIYKDARHCGATVSQALVIAGRD